MDVVGYVPRFPVIVVVLTAPATVIPAPARTAKVSAVPRSILVVAANTFDGIVKKIRVKTSNTKTKAVDFLTFIYLSVVTYI